MIDTVSITIPEDNFKILDHDKFSPNTENLFKPPYIKVTGRAVFKAINNPSKTDKEKYGYLPRVTLFKSIRRGGFQVFIKVEFSIPKLLYGNNFDEVEESEFGEVCWQLKAKLEKMGVEIIDVNKLAYADVSTIHYGKNIVLTDGSIPYSYLKEVAKINISRLRDTNQSDYRNGGHAVKYHSNDYEVVLYDKLADIKQAKLSDKRAIESDNYTQLNLFDTYQPKKPFEVLRIEVRLGSRKKIKQTLKKHSMAHKALNFSELFSKGLSQKILLATVAEIELAYPNILKHPTKSLQERYIEMQLHNPKTSNSQILKLIGIQMLLAECGVREFRKSSTNLSNRQWYRLNKEMKELKTGKQIEVFEHLKNEIIEFSKVALSDYQQG